MRRDTRKWLSALLMLMAARYGLAADIAVNNASLEFGTGAEVNMLRLGIQSDWKRRWFEGGGSHLTGYWDASLAQWRGSAYRNVPGQHQNITSIGLTPVFRLQSDDLKGWYLEGAIGLHLLSQRYNNDARQLSTRLQFGDHLGFGYVFDNQWEAGLKLQHFSNGGVKRPNDGVNFVQFKLARPF